MQLLMQLMDHKPLKTQPEQLETEGGCCGGQGRLDGETPWRGGALGACTRNGELLLQTRPRL